jgi:hypothetical protein
MSLVVVPAISAQPHSALLQQIESQWNPFDLNRSQQSANRCQRFTSTDRHKDGVTFNGVQVGLGGFSDRPCQVGLVHNVFHDHDRLVLLSWPQSWRLTRCDSEGIFTASHGQATRKPPSFVLNWISTVPIVRDGADARAHLHRVANLEIHLPTSTAVSGIAIMGVHCARCVMALPVRNRVAGRSIRRGHSNKVHLAHYANTLCT